MLFDLCRRLERTKRRMVRIAWRKRRDIAEARVARNGRVIDAILRICPKCGDDMCGDNHDICYKCELAEEQARKAALRRQVEILARRAATQGCVDDRLVSGACQGKEDDECAECWLAWSGGTKEPDALALLKAVHDHLEALMYHPHPDAPGHGHSVRGRWDRDGTPCEWCATWDRVRECVKANAEDHRRRSRTVQPLVGTSGGPQ
jgi:hypothetical protein